MRPQSHSPKNWYSLCKWLEDHGIKQDKTHTADLATIALGFKINPADIGNAADVIGLDYPANNATGLKPTQIALREIIRILNALDMDVPHDLICVSHRKRA